MEKYPFQPWLVGAKDIFLFATMTEGYQDANFIGFSHNIYENELTSENMYLPMNFTKKSQFYFPFLKVYSQNPKLNLQYLTSVTEKYQIVYKCDREIYDSI